MSTAENNSLEIIANDIATGILPVPGGRPITVIGTNPIRAGFGQRALERATLREGYLTPAWPMVVVRRAIPRSFAR